MNRMEMQLKGMDDVLDTLRSLPKEVVSNKGGPVKLALAKGARHLRDKAKENLKRSIARNGSESTGLLEENVIASRGKELIRTKGERYLVRVKRKAYDGSKITKKESYSRNRKRVTTLQTANLLEYGSSHQPATPWLRPAVRQHGAETINIITKDLVRRIDLVVKKLARQNRSK